MIEIAGKQAFTELSEMVDPARTALLVVDMQRDFCCADGSFGRLGVDLSMYPPVIERVVEPLSYTLDGSEGQQFVPGLEPRDSELVVEKYRSSAFMGTVIH